MSRQPSRPFQLLIKPVGPRCNLACRYCFYSGSAEPDPTLPPVMPDAVLEAMLRKYLELRLPQSIVCWQGGEPTLAGLDFFRRVIELEQAHGVRGQVVSNALQTNGQLIDDEWAELLARFNFLVGLSIDGPPEIHDAQRVNAAGAGSLEKALRAAKLFQKHGVEFNILTVIHAGNQARAREVFAWQLEQGWRHLQYIPCVESDAEGRPLPFSCSAEGYGRFLSDLWQAYRESGRRDVGIRTFDSWITQKVRGANTLCTLCEDCGDYLLIKPDGGIYPCDFFFEPQWKLGNVLDDDLVAAFDDVRPRVFGHLKGSVDDECRSCPHLSLCNGGCPKDRMSKADGPGDGTGRSALCEGYRQFFGEHGADLSALATEIQRQCAEHERQRQQALRQRVARMGAGRNDPCPCGSGRKFKKCCGR